MDSSGLYLVTDVCRCVILTLNCNKYSESIPNTHRPLIQLPFSHDMLKYLVWGQCFSAWLHLWATSTAVTDTGCLCAIFPLLAPKSPTPHPSSFRALRPHLAQHISRDALLMCYTQCFLVADLSHLISSLWFVWNTRLLIVKFTLQNNA